MWWGKGKKALVKFVNETGEAVRLRERFGMLWGEDICACLPPGASVQVPAYGRHFFRLRTFFEVHVMRPSSPDEEEEEAASSAAEDETETTPPSGPSPQHRTPLNPLYMGTVEKPTLRTASTIVLRMGENGFVYAGLPTAFA